ncbi:MAG: hypothetical protein IIA03_08300 [Proteobacteria bacterium]|jgi:hypothetical protein|nr:hypothetical protein [Methylibium sp.]MBY0368136.1 hypothetical protein [Burkholderiaceae bacterium]MCH8856222.1 hypothetical protein [Pseudomonadota bacterium]|mmetsp:Transcript_6765/g.28428  ORF Transcript_6765/g.28428 Transcript_6765/m.28428 type:complete len:197 (+) Transcript_6765:5120-5710(+)
MTAITAEIAAAAARLIVDEGMDWGPAKQRAARDLGLPRAALPGNDEVEDAVREHIAIFHADTQPAELRALRELAAQWMDRLAEFRPHLTGAVWRGTATRLSNVHLQLYCDDSKAAEIALLNRGLSFDVAETTASKGRTVDMLILDVPCPSLGERVTLCLTILDFDDLRGALKADARGLTERGDLAALQSLLNAPPP